MQHHTPVETSDALRAVCGRIAEEAGLDLVALFGSSAREGLASGRDVDLAVRGPEPLDLVDLTNSFTRALGRQEVDLADLRRADPVLLMLVAEEGVPLYEGVAGGFVSFQSLAARRFFDTRKFREAERQEIHDSLERTGKG